MTTIATQKSVEILVHDELTYQELVDWLNSYSTKEFRSDNEREEDRLRCIETTLMALLLKLKRKEK